MKKLILFFMLIVSAGYASSQSEVRSDTLRHAPSASVKEFGGFLLDMGLMSAARPELPTSKLQIPSVTKDYNKLFRLPTDIIFSQGATNVFSFLPSPGLDYGSRVVSAPQFMQMGTFRLKNGMRMNTYGDYDKDGWKVPDRTLLPWQKNDFRGAFELKSANGAFGIRLEVRQERNSFY